MAECGDRETSLEVSAMIRVWGDRVVAVGMERGKLLDKNSIMNTCYIFVFRERVSRRY